MPKKDDLELAEILSKQDRVKDHLMPAAGTPDWIPAPEDWKPHPRFTFQFWNEGAPALPSVTLSVNAGNAASVFALTPDLCNVCMRFTPHAVEIEDGVTEAEPFCLPCVAVDVANSGVHAW